MFYALFSSIKLRFMPTEGLLEALNMLARATEVDRIKNDPDFADKIQVGKKLIAKELIRRDILFWED